MSVADLISIVLHDILVQLQLPAALFPAALTFLLQPSAFLSVLFAVWNCSIKGTRLPYRCYWLWLRQTDIRIFCLRVVQCILATVWLVL